MISTSQVAGPVFICLAAVALVSTQAQSTVPTNEDIVAQMAQAQADNRIRIHSYTITRDYKLFAGENHNQAKSHVIAEITIVPPNSEKYIIHNVNGSGWGANIVRKMLDSEVTFTKDSSSAAITRENYDFQFVREDELRGQHCYVLVLIPKRKSTNLLRGIIWVDANTYLPLRVEGEPANSPSWWLRDVRIILFYGPVGEMWLQTSSGATANVRVLGRSSMVSRDVKYQVGELAPVASLAQKMVSVEETTAEGQR